MQNSQVKKFSMQLRGLLKMPEREYDKIKKKGTTRFLF